MTEIPTVKCSWCSGELLDRRALTTAHHRSEAVDMQPQLEQARAQAFEEAAKVVEPKGSRPCDCERCYCHNQGDAEAVASWDAGMATAKAIRLIAGPSALTPERCGDDRAQQSTPNDELWHQAISRLEEIADDDAQGRYGRLAKEAIAALTPLRSPPASDAAEGAAISGDDRAQDAQARPDAGQIMAILRKVTVGSLYDSLTCKRWKDGIEYTAPTYAAECLAEEFAALGSRTPADIEPAQCERMNGGDWAKLLTLRDVMKRAYTLGGNRLMSVWERDVSAIEAAIAELSTPELRSPAEGWRQITLTHDQIFNGMRLDAGTYEVRRVDAPTDAGF
ncbi:hypothetical protein [Bradyrhizobium sp. Arg816]|uniref:hypothetical protein n=1 Tax=Bradyrhizobium sp. Arg816 TaxID=2998491 RepID=UPI00249F920C|nr:hypothetical protein [Bradyrhizobium sp. Arg816]MDI3563521.1 hypothetical protein [Bradyrhizobium sp. Arg816]